MYIQDIERLLTEIEMLRIVLYLVCRNNRRSKASYMRTASNQEKVRIARSVCVSLCTCVCTLLSTKGKENNAAVYY
jgi:hypothetical protein